MVSAIIDDATLISGSVDENRNPFIIQPSWGCVIANAAEAAPAPVDTNRNPFIIQPSWGCVIA